MTSYRDAKMKYVGHPHLGFLRDAKKTYLLFMHDKMTSCRGDTATHLGTPDLFGTATPILKRVTGRAVAERLEEIREDVAAVDEQIVRQCFAEVNDNTLRPVLWISRVLAKVA